MADNEALNVVIGIVLIYLLYSMLITILGEFVTAHLGMRARILRVALERMLNDGYYRRIDKAKLIQITSTTEKFKDQIKRQGIKISGFVRNFLLRTFLYEPDAFKTSFAGRFYDYPAIKYLSRTESNSGILRLFKQTKPAYISSDYFSDTLISMLKDKSTGVTDIEKIAFTLRYNTQHIQPTTLKIIRDHFENANEDINLFKVNLIKWFNETMDRANGWYKRKLQVVLLILGFLVAASFNVDTIKIVKILSSNKEARRQLVDLGIKLSKDTTKYKDFTKTTKDSIRASAVIDSGLAHVTKDITDVNKILGAGWTFSGHEKLDSFTLSRNRALMSSYEKLASANKDRNQTLASLAQHRKAFDKKNLELVNTTYDIKLLANQIRFKGPTDSLNNALKKKQADSTRFELIRNDLLIKLTRDSMLKLDHNKTIKSLQKPFLPKEFNRLTTIRADAKDKNIFLLTGYRKYSLRENSGLFISQVFSNFAGLFLTALALSLGAPFWFSLLNKLISIRSAGVKPDDKPAEHLTLKTGSEDIIKAKDQVDLTNSSPPAEQALDAFTRKVAHEAGIVSLSLNAKENTLILKVANSEAQKYLKEKYGEEYQFTSSYRIGIKYALAEPNKVHSLACGSGITNQNKPDETGTLGCYLKKKDSGGIYFLSCWHVLNDDHTYDQSIEEVNVISKQTSKIIGEVVDGCLTDKIDVGIAIQKIIKEKNDPDKSLIRRQHRAVIPYDSLINTPVTLIGKNKNAVLFDHKLNIKLEYPDGQEYIIYDVFSITGNLESGSLSAPTSGGDSGTVIIDRDTGAPLGMVIGGNDQFSYAVKFTNIFSPGTPYKNYSFIIK